MTFEELMARSGGVCEFCGEADRLGGVEIDPPCNTPSGGG